MRKTLLLSFLLGLTFLSCTQNSDENIVSTQDSGGHLYLTSQQFHTTSSIDGALGDELIIDQNFVDNEGRSISIYASLNILPNAYTGTRSISMIINTEDASIQFFPELSFNRDVRLNLTFTGLDLNALGYTSSRYVDFVYFNNNGSTELIENSGSSVNIAENKISVQNAKLLHFSRYGWVR